MVGGKFFEESHALVEQKAMGRGFRIKKAPAKSSQVGIQRFSGIA
jgi:hypothetical protein